MLDPLRLRPALALELFKGKTHFLGGNGAPGTSNQANIVGRQQTATPHAQKTVRVPQGDSKAAAGSVVKPCKWRINERAPPGGSKEAAAAAESVAKMSKRRPHGRGTTRGWEKLGPDEKNSNQSERRTQG
ncbi:unnamed protein product, partial [Laminaria digitata]